MSIDTQLSKQELSKQLESYINHTLQGQAYDPSQSGCVVQIVSGNPFRIADATNHIDVNDSSNITAKLKETNPNTNWHTMRGAALSLKKWGFTSSYDSANDKLKLDIIVDEVDCLQDGGASSPKVSELVPLLEDSKLKGKVNRLRKFYMAEELNHVHPVEVALEQIDRERKNTSDMRKMANVNHLRQQEIGASLESDRNGMSFWDAVEHPERQIPAFHASEPNYEESRIHFNKPQYQTLPENMFQNLEGYDSQPNLFQGSMQEENIYDMLNQGELSDKKNTTNEDRIEIEEEVRIQQQEEPLKEVPPAIKRKFFDIVNEKKDSLEYSSKLGTKKLFRGPAIDSAAEQQRLMKARDSRKLGTFQDSGELDTLGLLGASFTQETQPQIQVHQVKNVFPPKQQQQQQQPERIYETERTQRLLPSVRRDDNEPLKEYNSPSYRKPSPQRVIDEEINEAIADYEKSRSRKESLERQQRVVQPRQQKQSNLSSFKRSAERKVSRESDDLLEISNNDYLKSFKMVHFAPSSQSEFEERRASFANRKESAGKKAGFDSFDDYEEISFREPIRQQQQQQQQKYPSGKSTPSNALYVENPFDQRYMIDLNSFKDITFKSATTSIKRR